MRLHCTAFAVCVLPFFLTACGDTSADKDPRDKPPLVKTATVEEAAVAARSFTGVVVARTQSDLGFRVAGKVLERLVDTGEQVKRGQPLLRLDPVDLKLQARARQDSVASIRARVRQTADDEARYRGLVAEGAVSASAYDRIKAAADTANAQLSAAQAEADVARHATDYAVLLADADGVVVETLAEPGQVVSAGEPVVRLARAGQREALLHLPETLRPEPGSQARARLYGTPGPALPAKLRLLSQAADPATRTFEARYVLSGRLADAPLGATITLKIGQQADGTQVRQVPVSALYDPGNGTGVWVVVGEPPTVSWRPVRVLDVSDDAARVVGELNAGEQVVALGVHLLREGEEVRSAPALAAQARELQP